MAESKLPNELGKNEPIKAAHLTAVYQFVKKHTQHSSGFVSPAFEVTRPTRGGQAIQVFKLTLCSDATVYILSDNPAFADHTAGDIAVIEIDGVIECWVLGEPQDKCATGICVNVLGWTDNCEFCQNPCFTLTACDDSDIFLVRGIEWIELLGLVVKINDVCYIVSESQTCEGVDETVTTDDIQVVYPSCALCGCYRLKLCNTATEEWVNDDIAGLYGLPDGEMVVGGIIKINGKCWEIMEFENPCTHSGTAVTIGLTQAPEVAENCNQCCYLLTPCPGQAGSPTTKKVIPSASDPVDLSQFIDSDGNSNGKVLMLFDYVCYTVSIAPDCTSAVTLGTVLDTYDDCDCCGITCWKKCKESPADPDEYLRTYSDLCQYQDSFYAVKRAEDGFCYTFEPSLSNCDALPIVIFTVQDVYTHDTDACAVCLHPQYKLTPDCDTDCSDCVDEEDAPEIIYSDDETLNEAVGRWVKVSGICYKVETDITLQTVTAIQWTGPYDSCKECELAPTCLTVITKEGDNFFATTIKFIGTVCKKEPVDIPCPTEPP